MRPTAVAPTETDELIHPFNSTPRGFDPARDLPAGFMEFFLPLHHRFTPRQRELARKRAEVLQRSLEGDKPKHRFPADRVRKGWQPPRRGWSRPQPNQMPAPADDGELCVKMLNSG